MNTNPLPPLTDAPFADLRDLDFPSITQLTDNLYAACFSVIKLFAARSILEDGIAKGLLKPGTHVIESTSGTFGLALAMLKNYYGYELTLVSDPVVDPMLRQRFAQMGVHLDIVESPQDGSYQVARLARVRAFLERNPGAFFCNQYYNPANLVGYARLADHLHQRVGAFDLVGAVGTGGSMCGTSQRLQEVTPDMRVIGVDTHRSVIFGQPNGPRNLRGLGNSLVPGNVHHDQFDQVHWVSASEAYRATRQMQSEYGLFMGGTSGAAFIAARWHAAQNPDRQVLFLCPDEGYRYLDTVYNDAHLASLPGADAMMPTAPQPVTSPLFTETSWACMDWNRRSRDAVLATAQAA